MGSEVAARPEAAPEKGTPTKAAATNFNVDLSQSTDVKSVFGYNPLCEVGPSGKPPEIGIQDLQKFSEGKATDILGAAAKRDGITLPATKIVDGDTVLADGAKPESQRLGADGAAPVPPLSQQVKLDQNTLDAGKVGKKEGYYQVAERLMGPGFNHNERKEFSNALRDSWKSQPGFENATQLSRGDQLLNQNNMDTVLNSIKDEGLRGRIRERLNSGEVKPATNEPGGENRNRDQTPRRRGEDTPRVAPEKREQTPKRDVPSEGETPRDDSGPRKKGRELTPDRDRTPPQIAPKDQIAPRDDRAGINPRDDRFRDPSASYDRDALAPEGQIKSPFDRKFNVGDRFTGLTSVYGSGRSTASGLPFDKYEMTAASKEFPFGTVLKVTNPDTGITARVVVNDHGPFAGKMVNRPDGTKTHARVLDLSVGAANAIGMGHTVKNLQIAVESIPQQGKWGEDRRNIHGDYKRSVIAKINELSRRRG